MDKSNDADNTPKPFGHDWDLHVEKYCRRGMVEQYNYAKNSLLADINTGMKNGAKRMEDAAAVLAAQDRRMADRLANDIPMGKDLDEKLCRDAINYMRDYMRNKYGVDILSSALESFHAPDVETMAIASNIEECIVIRNFGGRSAGESHQGDTTQEERTEDSEPDAPFPRLQRERHAHHPRGLSSPPSPEPSPVVDEEDSDVDSDWAASANAKPTKKVERRKKTRSKARVGKPSGRNPPRAEFGRRANRGMTPRTASIPVFSELNTGRSEAAAGGAPAAEMGAADLWITRATDVYSADWDRQEDAMFPVTRITSDIPPVKE